MSTPRSFNARTGVVLATAVLVVLAGLLAARLLARESGAGHALRPPAVTVPAPKPVDLAALEIQCWSCPRASAWPLRFRTDLDMLAPLGTGSANAARWFAAFAKPDGPRFKEAEAAEARRVDHDPIGKVLPPDDPLLLEAEPWCDQATMHFYPEVFPLKGPETQLPNLLMALTLARSWLARGAQAASLDAAVADLQRAIRLGRLLRQDDAVLINDLVGLACIRIGAEAIYDRARKDGKLELALAAAAVAAEAPPQKLLSAAKMTSVELAPFVRPVGAGKYALELPDKRLDAIVAMVSSDPDRRFRCEAMWDLRVVSTLGPAAQAARARATLEAAAREADPIVAGSARAFLARQVEPEDVASMLEQMTR
jgi:hypothetical protein